MRVRVVAVCPSCGTHWDHHHDAPGCTDGGHGHQLYEVHVHRCRVLLPDGTAVAAASFDEVDAYEREDPPDYGLYLDPRWRPPWPHDHVDWPDFGVPADRAAVLGDLTSLLDRARSGQRVEIGCLGGHGRTGTALACLAVLAGHPAGDAVGWVRAQYCPAAVETPDQEAFVAGPA